MRSYQGWDGHLRSVSSQWVLVGRLVWDVMKEAWRLEADSYFYKKEEKMSGNMLSTSCKHKQLSQSKHVKL